MDLVFVARGHVYDAGIYERACHLRRRSYCFTQDAFPAQFMRMVLWKKIDIGGIYKTMDYVLGFRCLIGQVDGDLSARTRSLGMITLVMSVPLTQRRTGSRERLDSRSHDRWPGMKGRELAAIEGYAPRGRCTDRGVAAFAELLLLARASLQESLS